MRIRRRYNCRRRRYPRRRFQHRSELKFQIDVSANARDSREAKTETKGRKVEEKGEIEVDMKGKR